MYIRFVFEESNGITSLSDPSTVSKPGYTYGPPELVDELPANTAANAVIKTEDAGKEQTSYYLDCQNLDRKTVEAAVHLFYLEKFEDKNQGLSAVVLPDSDDMPFIKTMKQALEKSKQQPKQIAEGFNYRNYLTNRNLLFVAGTVAAIGAIGATVAVTHAYFRNNSGN